VDWHLGQEGGQALQPVGELPDHETDVDGDIEFSRGIARAEILQDRVILVFGILSDEVTCKNLVLRSAALHDERSGPVPHHAANEAGPLAASFVEPGCSTQEVQQQLLPQVVHRVGRESC
jgi:hypothetical protein